MPSRYKSKQPNRESRFFQDGGPDSTLEIETERSYKVYLLDEHRLDQICYMKSLDPVQERIKQAYQSMIIPSAMVGQIEEELEVNLDKRLLEHFAGVH